MNREFVVNRELYKKMKKTQYKKHPKWNKRSTFRKVLYTFAIFTPLLVAFMVFNNDSMVFVTDGGVSLDDRAFSAFTLSLFVSAFTTLPAVIYYHSLKTTCNDNIIFEGEENLLVDDTGITNSFSLHLQNSTGLQNKL